MTSIDLPERPRILVVTLRRLGDVLLTTPLVRTIRAAWPRIQAPSLTGHLHIIVQRAAR